MSQHKNIKHSKHKKEKRPWLPVILTLGGMLLIFGAFLYVANQSGKPKAAIEVTGSPSLRVDREEVDLGNVKLGRTVSASFQLTNVGDQTLRFSESPYIEVLEGC